jgi:hypothetical protein
MGGNFLTFIPAHGIVVAALSDAPINTGDSAAHQAPQLSTEEFGHFISRAVAATR